MASLHPSWFSSLRMISPAKPALFSFANMGVASTTFKHAKLCCVLSPDNAESSEPTSPNSLEPASDTETGPIDPLKLAFGKAKAYKESMKSKSSLGDEQKDADSSGKEGDVVDDGQKDLPASVKIAMERAKKYKQDKGVVVDETTQVMKSKSSLGDEQKDADSSGKEGDVVDGGQKDLPLSVKIAMEKAKKYKQNKGVVVDETTQGLQGGSERTSGKDVMDNSVGKKGELSVSRIDFMGLDFSDKKSTRGLPPGLVPISDPFSASDLPEVELIVGDTSKFDAATDPQPEQTVEDESELYKPKVSTWGVFPRPGNISKTFGGGRVIRPGEVLETDEEKAAKDARTKQLLAAYKKKIGLSIDPKLKSECEKALKDGDLLMNAGKLKEALPYYEKVMDKLTFQSEIHGLAALRWSICQDSLSRPDEARSMYEKLQSHPNAKVNKRARQFMYSFQAMEMMKVTTGSPFYLKNTGYQNYFDAFIENKSNYPLEDGVVQESGMNQVLLYILFLVSPILVVLLIAVQKRI